MTLNKSTDSEKGCSPEPFSEQDRSQKADVTTVNETRTNPNIKKKATAEDRRKQLEEWQKSKEKSINGPLWKLKQKEK